MLEADKDCQAEEVEKGLISYKTQEEDRRQKRTSIEGRERTDMPEEDRRKKKD